MFIQLPKHIRRLLEDSTVKENIHGDVESAHSYNTLAIHVLVFKASQRNWTDYNDYLAERISELVRLFIQVKKVKTETYCSTISPVFPKSALNADTISTLNLRAVNG